MPALVVKVLTGPLKGQERRFDRFPIVIGRSPDCMLSIPGDEKISRAHARIRHVPQGFQLKDLQSKNGTYLDEVRLTEPVTLTGSKVIRIGHTLLQLVPEGFVIERVGLPTAATPGAAGQAGPQDLVEAVLVLDLCDSTTIANRYGDAFALRLKEAMRALARPIFAQAGVSFLKGTGDGFLATFPDLTAAVEAAICILHLKETKLPRASDGTRPLLRFGVHFGETRVDSEGDRQGDVVNIAFRFERVGLSGFHETYGGLLRDAVPLHDRIFISEHAHEELQRASQIPTQLVGFFDLKGIAGRHRVYEVLWREIPIPEEEAGSQTITEKTD